MPRRSKAKGIYQRGQFWLDWDRKADGALRSPNLAIFWYDPAAGRNRSASAGTPDDEAGCQALDAHYLKETQGAAICPTCGQLRPGHGSGFLVAQAVVDYLTMIEEEDRPSKREIRARLAHVTRYLVTLRNPTVTCEQVDEAWIGRFRRWAANQPMISTAGNRIERKRSAATIEGSVRQLAAAINAAHRRHDTTFPAKFKPIKAMEVAETPQHRSSLKELAAMFRYATALDTKGKSYAGRQALHRFLMLSVATLGRPDAVIDLSTSPERGQWIADRRVINLNPKGRRQTQKYRATVKAPRQIVPHLLACKGRFVGINDVTTAWKAMAKKLNLPMDGQSGLKLIRRSMAQLIREREVPAEQRELQMGHRQHESIGDIYAPFLPEYLKDAVTAIEGVIADIEKLAPKAFHRNNTGDSGNVIALPTAKSA